MTQQNTLYDVKRVMEYAKLYIIPAIQQHVQQCYVIPHISNKQVLVIDVMKNLDRCHIITNNLTTPVTYSLVALKQKQIYTKSDLSFEQMLQEVNNCFHKPVPLPLQSNQQIQQHKQNNQPIIIQPTNVQIIHPINSNQQQNTVTNTVTVQNIQPLNKNFANQQIQKIHEVEKHEEMKQVQQNVISINPIVNVKQEVHQEVQQIEPNVINKPLPMNQNIQQFNQPNVEPEIQKEIVSKVNKVDVEEPKVNVVEEKKEENQQVVDEMKEETNNENEEIKEDNNEEQNVHQEKPIQEEEKEEEKKEAKKKNKWNNVNENDSEEDDEKITEKENNEDEIDKMIPRMNGNENFKKRFVEQLKLYREGDARKIEVKEFLEENY